MSFFIAFSSCFASQEVTDLFISLIPYLRQDQEYKDGIGHRIARITCARGDIVRAYCHTITLLFVLEQTCACFSDSP
jgi:hypothetical protein